MFYIIMFLFHFVIIIYSRVCILFGSFLHAVPFPHVLHPTHHIQAEPVWPLSLILLKRRHKHNKENKVFLLVDLRIAIQRDC
jgi:hypothetical protein